MSISKVKLLLLKDGIRADIARCLYVKLLQLKDGNKSSFMFVWLDIARCLYVKLLLLID